MLSVNKRKGVLLVILGVVWIIFVYNFDTLSGRTTKFGDKALLGFALGILSVINGIRIYRRDVRK